MKGPAWEALVEEIGRWRNAGNVADFWWRDDDAGPPSIALGRLLGLASRTSVPLAVAAIPSIAEPAAFAEIDSEVAVIQHGVDHENRARASEKKTEFPAAEPFEQALCRLVEGRRQLEIAAGERCIPVLAPPWNRFPAPLLSYLGVAGFRGLSTFGVRKVTYPAQGVLAVNTHVDIIDWKGTRGFCGADQALAQATRHLAARRMGGADALEPTGWLTHHAVHDEQCWNFLETLFEATRALDGVRWRSAVELFGCKSGI